MAKDKNKGPRGIHNKHLHARVSYLHQAANYLAMQAQQTGKSTESPSDMEAHQESAGRPQEVTVLPSAPITAASNGMVSQKNEPGQPVFRISAAGGLSHHLISNMLLVAQKSQIRLHTSVKHGTCKRCNSPLIPGKTCTKSVENASRGQRKPHADVLVVKCKLCEAVKRFPIGANRQASKSQRQQTKDQAANQMDIDGAERDQPMSGITGNE